MGLRKAIDRAKARELLDGAIERPVELALVTADQDCEYCDQVLELLSEIAELSDTLTVSVLDRERDAAQAAALKLDTTPGIAILGGTEQTDYGGASLNGVASRNCCATHA